MDTALVTGRADTPVRPYKYGRKTVVDSASSALTARGDRAVLREEARRLGDAGDVDLPLADDLDGRGMPSAPDRR